MKILELFSGTHSVGKVAKKLRYEVVSVDRDLDGNCPLGSDYVSNQHVKTDIMTWDYKNDFNVGDFDVITASPVCLWWSCMRRCRIKEDKIKEDIENLGKPMIDKVIEIIEYFKPNFWWIENPQTGKMKNYIEEKYPLYNTFYDVDYCKYSEWGYMKRTRFWTNIKDFKPLKCKKDCKNIIDGRHKVNIAYNQYVIVNNKKIFIFTKELRNKYKDHIKYKSIRKNTKFERYRIPEKLIEQLFRCI
jgi:site-specific DNA-cytosine methylase